METEDRLTGLIRRSEFDERFKEELTQAAEEDYMVTLALMDIDWFKNVNSEHGHKAGDAVLREIASTLKRGAPSGTCIARIGGEEFALLFPKTERERAFLAIEQMRSMTEEIGSYVVDADSMDIKVTVSGGVAAYPTDGTTTIEILRKADQALYRAKVTGRNKICIAQEEKMATKTTHYTLTQLERLTRLSEEESVVEAVLLREALDDLLTKYRVSSVES